MKSKIRVSQQEKSQLRKAELIDATLQVIAREGVSAATVRSISEQANVTQGLIRYHFTNKDELITAAYEKHMTDLIDLAAHSTSDRRCSNAKARLAMFVRASVIPPVVDTQVLAIWAGFFQLLFHNEPMRESHKKTYHLLRRHIQTLIADVLEEEKRTTSEAELRILSIACNAILDGIWIEGGIIPEEFGQNELIDTVINAVSAIIQTDLTPHRD
ncbi:TetR/AcrR family transcriptional regulator [Vibrio hippocampi]|uniref:HTH-type transcriptional regulator BetI n=1 Tax=Vibrio hippocampi TaxID=654686 RepID=A0ABN8DQC4_9VIBR|nr:TetR family transcriptional regulator [Vibrio hippocampi]CAH0529870.1 HTH-type transcriptional regulator BetI [Vibrio hippocampi]